MEYNRLSYHASTARGYNNDTMRLNWSIKDPESHRKIIESKRRQEEREQVKLRKKYANFIPTDKNQKAKKIMPPGME